MTRDDKSERHDKNLEGLYQPYQSRERRFDAAHHSGRDDEVNRRRRDPSFDLVALCREAERRMPSYRIVPS